MRHDDSLRQLRVGIFLASATGMLLAAVFLLGRSQTLFAHRARLYTAFDNVSGLVVGAPVRLAGVDVGIVDAIRFDADLHHKRVQVALAVERRFLDRVRTDSLARLGSKGLLGDTIIDISVGSAEAAPLRDGATLRSQEGAGLTEIVGSLQQAIGEVRQLSGTVDERLKTVLTDDLARDLQRVARATADVVEHVQRGDGLAHALIFEPRLGRSAEHLLGRADAAANRAEQVLARLDGVVAQIEHGPGTAHGLIYDDGGARLLAELERVARDVDAIVGEVQHGHGLAHALVYDHDSGKLMDDLTHLSRTLRLLGDEVQQGKGTVGALLRDPSVYEDLKTILGNLKRNRLLKSLVRWTIEKDGLSAEGGK
jgi:phospholipid/cholesterol/gamma-HCH transport system substrate-binding protein